MFECYLSCFAFGAAVVVFCFDQVEEFELFQVVADPAVAQWFLVLGLTDFLVALVDVSGLYRCVCVFCELLDCSKQQAVVFGEGSKKLVDVFASGFLFDLFDVFFGD